MKIAKVIKFYADTKVGTFGKVLKSWDAPNGGWARLSFGKNQSGQKLQKSYPTDVLEMHDLLPCPFCGGAPKFMTIAQLVGSEQCPVFILCENINCKIYPMIFGDEDFQEVLSAWNTRRPQNAQADTIPRAAVAAALMALRNEYVDCPLLGQEWALSQLDATIAKLENSLLE